MVNTVVPALEENGAEPDAEGRKPGHGGRTARRGASPSSPASRGSGSVSPRALHGVLGGSVPARLRRLRAAMLVCAASVAAVVLASGITVDDSWSDIRGRSAPQVTSATGLYFTLNDMDAQLANQLLPGDTPSLAAVGRQSAALYATRGEQAAAYLDGLAVAAKGDQAAERDVSHAIADLAAYESDASRALLLGSQAHTPAGHADPRVVAAYTTASDLMRSRLLPEAQRLVDSNNAAFERGYTADESGESTARLVLLCAGLLLLLLLVGTQFYLTRRFHRVLNPLLAGGTLVAVAALVAGLVQIAAEKDDLRSARRDAFDSVVALTQARAVSYDANADESRYLLDRPDAAAHQRDFFTKSQRLLLLNGATLATYDTRLASAAGAYRANHADVEFGGFLGDEFRNITFPGERAAAERTLAAYRIYQADDRRIRTLATSGHLTEAIAYDAGSARGDSDGAFDQYDTALTGLIAINSRAFDRISAGGAAGALPVPGGEAGAMLLVAALSVAGLRPRLAEYR